MNVVIMGDMHGRGTWKRIMAHETMYTDEFVFVGDYFDSFNIPLADQIANLKKIIDFKHRMSSYHKVILLIGNHDYQYFPEAREAGEYSSGNQGSNGFVISHVLQELRHEFQMCYRVGNILITHAGITYKWLKDNHWKKEQDVCSFVNGLWKYKPLAFMFKGPEPTGDSISESPLWVRPRSLMRNAYGFNTHRQIVGHTGHNHIKSVKNRFYFIDVLAHNTEYIKVSDDIIFKKSMDKKVI